jgi:hypothetical protein
MSPRWFARLTGSNVVKRGIAIRVAVYPVVFESRQFIIQELP